MTGFQSRVIDELSELNLKINALTALTIGSVFKSLDPVDQSLLLRQLDTMSAYRHILEKRIQRF